MIQTLDAYWDDTLVGTLHNSQPLRFTYDTAWLANPAARAIAPNLPLQKEAHIDAPVVAFFENLLPEGRIRQSLATSHQATTLFGLLHSIAGDTAGGLVLLPQGESLAPPRYLSTTWHDVATRLSQEGPLPAADGADHGARISLAGAQNKLPLMLLPDGNPAYPLGTAPSSHILKPNINGFTGVWASALNETFTMQLATALGLGVAVTQYQSETHACLVQRYDREPNTTGQLRRLHQLDLCQLADRPSDVKYESDGGPSLKEIRSLLQSMGVPAADLKRLLLWVLFNLCVGNHDSHAKNVSVVFTGGTWRLAPFYDLMCTALYPSLSRTFAFQIGGQNAPGKIGRAELGATATELGFSPRYVLRLANEILKAMPNALSSVVQNLADSTQPGTEQILLERLQHFLKDNIRKCAQRWLTDASG